MSKKTTAKEKYALVATAGRELAQGYLRNAVATAPDNEVMSNQILTLQFCAMHILATCVLNKVMQHQVPLNQAAEGMFEALSHEIDIVMNDDEEPELVEVKGVMQ